MSPVNEFGQPIGPALPDWRPCPFPDVAALVGHWCRVEPLLPDHAAELFDELCGEGNADLWTYSSVGPFSERVDFADFVERRARDTTTVAVTIRDSVGVACGLANLLAVNQHHGSIEVGGIVLGRRLQRTTAATEAMYLLAEHVFGLGYRRYEWKCDSLNAPSRSAAERFGFRHEGTFRNAVVYKGRSRDTDWFSITDAEWPEVRQRLQAWLAPDNFDAHGQQRRSLASL